MIPADRFAGAASFSGNDFPVKTAEAFLFFDVNNKKNDIHA